MTINKIKPRHPEKVNKPINPIKKKPNWIRSKLLDSKEFFLTKTVVNKDNLVMLMNSLLVILMDTSSIVIINDIDEI